jgi:hypothetical protein
VDVRCSTQRTMLLLWFATGFILPVRVRHAFVVGQLWYFTKHRKNRRQNRWRYRVGVTGNGVKGLRLLLL